MPDSANQKKKLTKAQLAEQKRLEDEQKQREEEEREWQAKISEKLKILQKERRSVERAHREELSESQVNGHFTEKLIDEFTAKWKQRCDEISDSSTWRQYMSCDPRPSFVVNKDISEFTSWMSLENERIQKKLSTNLNDNQVRVCMAELKDLLDVLSTYLPHSSTPELDQIYSDMQGLVNRLLDYSTLQLLKDSSGFKDDDSGNVQVEQHDEFHDVYLWGNLANNPRLKTIDFGKEGEPASHVQMSILKGMHSRNVALRVVRKSYDTDYPSVESGQNLDASPSTTSGVENVEIELPTYELTPVDSEAEEEAVDEAAEEEGEETPADAPTETQPESGETTKNPEEVAPTEETPVDDVPVDEKSEDGVSARSSGTSLANELPSDHFSMDDYAVTGGTWEFEIFEIPNQPKKSGRWIVRQLYDDTYHLNNISNDVVEKAQEITASQLALAEQEAAAENKQSDGAAKDSAIADDETAELALTLEDLEIEYKIFIPADQVILAPPEVAWFDISFNCWRESGIKNVKFDENTRELTFISNRLGKFAALQDRKLDLPYQNWVLRPVVRQVAIPNADPKAPPSYVEKIGAEFEVVANYTEIRLNVDVESYEISIVQQIHEEVSGTSIVADPDADPEEMASAESLREDKPFKLDPNTGESAVKDLKDSFMNKSVYLFPSLTQPCSIKKIVQLENTVYMQMAILTALRICQFSWTPVTSTQVMPKEEEEAAESVPASQKTSTQSVAQDDGETGVEDAEDERPKSPEVTIPVNDDPNYRALRDYEMVVKYAKVDSCPFSADSVTTLEPVVSTSDVSQVSSVIKQIDWRLLFIRYPHGPCYKLAMEDSDDIEAPAVFSREIAPDSKYHSDLIHAVIDDLGLNSVDVHFSARALDLIYVRTIADLLQETRVLSNSV